ncbi:MAG TPA: FkbM family methyltransferase [Ramlibacter sp.]|nr:FkbM family methyltransferase [Ramlibacter sp.]
MRFISYAQNYEDVMLWRALGHVQGGFYLDVGANDPLKDSVTKAFYDRGWRGINVEPVGAHHADLQRDRPHDVNLRCAIGAEEGTIDLWECEIPGLATTDPVVVQRHVEEGRQGVRYRVPVRTLASVCAEHAAADIHFLKVDVEGGEESVLAGADFRRFRPWIVVVEATRPNSTEQNHEQWEHLLTGANYRYGYGDGLNRFYFAEEHGELAQALQYPPNVFDAFIVAQQFNAEQHVRELKALLEQGQALARRQDAALRASQTAMQSAQAVARQSQEQLAQARRHIADIYASSSWRVTGPIRWAGGWLRALRQGGVPPKPGTGHASRQRREALLLGAERPTQLDRDHHLPPRARTLLKEIETAAREARKRI